MVPTVYSFIYTYMLNYVSQNSQIQNLSNAHFSYSASSRYDTYLNALFNKSDAFSQMGILSSL